MRTSKLLTAVLVTSALSMANLPGWDLDFDFSPFPFGASSYKRDKPLARRKAWRRQMARATTESERWAKLHRRYLQRVKDNPKYG